VAGAVSATTFESIAAADLGRFAIKRRPSGWRSGPSGSDRQAEARQANRGTMPGVRVKMAPLVKTPAHKGGITPRLIVWKPEANVKREGTDSHEPARAFGLDRG